MYFIYSVSSPSTQTIGFRGNFPQMTNIKLTGHRWQISYRIVVTTVTVLYSSWGEQQDMCCVFSKGFWFKHIWEDAWKRIFKTAPQTRQNDLNSFLTHCFCKCFKPFFTAIKLQVITALLLSSWYIEVFLWFLCGKKPEYTQKSHLSDLVTVLWGHPRNRTKAALVRN